MNYILSKKVNDIGEFKLTNKELFYVSNKKIIQNENKILIELDNYWGINFNNNFFNVFTNRSNNTFWSYEGIKINKFDNRNFYHFLSKNDFIYYDRIDKKTKFNQIDLLDTKIGLSYLFEELIFSYRDGIIKSILYNKGNVLWQFSLEELALQNKKQIKNDKEPSKVVKFIGVIDQQLWVALNHHTVISLSLQTGKLVHQLSQIPNFNYPFGDIIPAPEVMQIDTKRNVLIGLAWEYYWEIDPITGKITMYNLLDYFTKLKLRNDFILNTYFNEEEGYLFFAGKKIGNQNDSQIACLDVNTKKVIWQYKFKPDEEGVYPQLRDIQGSWTKLGVLDNNNTLHIFEKQENIA